MLLKRNRKRERVGHTPWFVQPRGSRFVIVRYQRPSGAAEYAGGLDPGGRGPRLTFPDLEAAQRECDQRNREGGRSGRFL